jgi:hypothetical protein
MNDVPLLTQGRTIMYIDDTSVFSIGQDINELQKTTSDNTGIVEQYFVTVILFINRTRTT